MTTVAAPDRPRLLARALRLEYLTVGWNLIEGVIAIAAAMASGKPALINVEIRQDREYSGGIYV